MHKLGGQRVKILIALIKYIAYHYFKYLYKVISAYLKRHRANILSLLAFLLQVIFSVNTFGQQFIFDHYTQKDGLSFNNCYFILEDERGFIWISTESGLNRFDGLQFKTFYHDPSKNSSPSSDLGGNLYEDKNGYLWYYTYNEVLNRFDPSTEQFIDYKVTNPESKDLAENTAFGFCEDAHGILYMASKKGICRYNPIDQKIHLLLWDGQPLLPDILNCLFITSDNRLIAGTEEGIFEIDIEKKNVKFLPGTENIKMTVLDIAEDKNGNIWIGTWQNGLIKYNFSTSALKHYQYTDPNINLNNWIFNDIAIQQVGEKEIIWSTSTGPYLLMFDIETEILTYEYLAPYFPEHPESIGTSHILLDSQNALWITTSYGVLRLDPLKQLFKTFRLEPQKPLQYYSSVTAIYQDPNDNKGNSIWLAVPTWGLCNFNMQTQKAIWFNNFKTENNSELTINKILRKDDDELWLATYSGLVKFNTGNKTYTIYSHDKNDSNSISSNYISDLLYDQQGRLWISTFSSGVNIYNEDIEQFIRFKTDTLKLLPKTQLSENINDLAIDRNGNIWLARGYSIGDIAGVSTINAQSFEEAYYYQSASNPEFPIQDEIYSLFPDSYGNIWIGIPSGATFFNPVKNPHVFKRLTPANGFQSSRAYNFLQVGNVIWASGNNGLTLIDGATQKVIRSYMRADGLLDENVSSFELGFDGKIFIGDYAAFQYISANAIKPNKIIPKVHITNIQILDKDYFPGGLSPLFSSDLKLKYSQDKIKIEFAALNYTNPENNVFAYMLEGIDNDWTYSKIPFVNYNKLPAGTYTFRVKAANDNGIWNEEGDSFLIVISPPWYQTIWFYLVCFLLASAILYAIYKIRINNLLKLERMRNTISRDLHDDIGSTLSSISMMSKMAKSQTEKNISKTSELLDKINNRSEYMMESMGDIVWAVNPHNDQIEKILLRMRSFAADILEPMNIDYKFEVAEALLHFKVPLGIRRDFYLIYKEGINNVAKYSQCKNVVIKIYIDKSILHLIVKDDGIGFNTGEFSKGNGLNNYRSRAEKIKGKFTIHSAPNEGTEIHLAVPL